jgi:glycosyltransferase involved in cell wall biosynthesis
VTAAALASLGCLHDSPLPRLLFVSHARGGGVARHIDDLATLLEGHAEVLLLQPASAPFVSLHWLRKAAALRLWFHSAEDWDGLLRFLAALGIDRIHFHHVDGLPAAILEMPSRLGCAYDLTLHDYYPACPAYHLTDASGRYCASEPDCARCLDAHPAQWNVSIAQWRERFGKLLSAAARVIAPSNDAAARIRAFYPQVSPVCWPHPESERSLAAPPLRVLVPGALSAAKGLDVLESCVADAAQRGLGLHFVVLGYLGRPLAQWPRAPLSMTGEYRDGLLPELIASQGGDVLFFPAQCPETFSYTLSAALDSGLPIVASRLGAITERLEGRTRARLVPWNASSAEMNDALLDTGQASLPAPDAARPRMTFERYRSAYLAGLGERRVSGGAPPELEPRWLVEPPSVPQRHPLAFLFQDGVVCGKAGSVDELRRYAFDPDAMHADADARFMELIQALGQQRDESARRLALVQAETDRASARAHAAEQQLERLEGSTSWRLTAPLRRLARWLRAET